jgi:hypothetical protein
MALGNAVGKATRVMVVGSVYQAAPAQQHQAQSRQLQLHRVGQRAQPQLRELAQVAAVPLEQQARELLLYHKMRARALLSHHAQDRGCYCWV